MNTATRLPAGAERKKQTETKTHYPNFSFAVRASQDGFIDHQQSRACFFPRTHSTFFARVLVNVAVLSAPEMKIEVKKREPLKIMNDLLYHLKAVCRLFFSFYLFLFIYFISGVCFFFLPQVNAIRFLRLVLCF